MQDGIDAAGPGDALVMKGTCVGSSTIDRSLTLKGVSNQPFGPATLDGGGADRVLFVDFFDPERQGFSLTIENLTITHGFGEDGNGGGGLLIQGGTVFMKNSIVTGNSAGVLSGGGIEVGGGALTLTDTTVSNNSAGDGGGGIAGGGTLTIVDSTITGNSVTGVGGGLRFTGGSLTVRNSTVSENRASAGGGVFNVDRHLEHSQLRAVKHRDRLSATDTSQSRRSTMLGQRSSSRMSSTQPDRYAGGSNGSPK